MQFHYDLTGAEPIVRDVPVYDASTTASFTKGEMLMLGTTEPDADADQNISFVTGYIASAAQCVDALGTILETVANAAALYNGASPKYAKAIINPFAIYLCEYSQAASDDEAVTTGGVSTTVTIASFEDDTEGGWLYFPLAAAGAKGKLRYVSENNGSGALTVDSAITTTTDDTVIKILPVNHRLTNLTADATKLLTQAAVGDNVSLHVLENYIESDGHGLQALKPALHKGLNGLSNAKFYADIAMLDHVYNNA
jgi:hypothetical protein